MRNFIVSFQCCCCCCIRIYFVDIFGISIHTFVVVSHLPCSHCRCGSRTRSCCLSRTQAHSHALTDTDMRSHTYAHFIACDLCKLLFFHLLLTQIRLTHSIALAAISHSLISPCGFSRLAAHLILFCHFSIFVFILVAFFFVFFLFFYAKLCVGVAIAAATACSTCDSRCL